MAKFVSLETSTDGELYLPLDTPWVPVLVSGTKVEIIFTNDFSYTLDLVTAGATVTLLDAIRAAQKKAAESNWRDVIESVAIPSGTTVAEYSFVAVGS